MPPCEAPVTPLRRTRLLLADDHRMFVESLGSTLAADYDVVGVVHDGADLLALVDQCDADCLLLDVVLGTRNGLELIPAIRTRRPHTKVLVVTMLVDHPMAALALDSGAHGFVPKDAGLEELKLAISEVLAGRRYVSSRLARTTHRVGLQARHATLRRLTPREQEVLLLLGEGKSETLIARHLGVSPNTITFHKKNLMRTLGIETNAFLTQYAVRVRSEIEEP